MQKIATLTIHLIYFLLWATTSIAAPLDAPHNETNNIRCNTCHTYSAWWQYTPASNNDTALSIATNSTCLSCHDGSNVDAEPVMQAHNSANLGTAHGT